MGGSTFGLPGDEAPAWRWPGSTLESRRTCQSGLIRVKPDGGPSRRVNNYGMNDMLHIVSFAVILHDLCGMFSRDPDHMAFVHDSILQTFPRTLSTLQWGCVIPPTALAQAHLQPRNPECGNQTKPLDPQNLQLPKARCLCLKGLMAEESSLKVLGQPLWPPSFRSRANELWHGQGTSKFRYSGRMLVCLLPGRLLMLEGPCCGKEASRRPYANDISSVAPGFQGRKAIKFGRGGRMCSPSAGQGQFWAEC